jgi:hypothetical protein
MKEAIFRASCRSGFFLLLAFWCAGAHAQPAPTLPASSPPPSLQAEADRYYSEKSYALALDDYRRLLASLPKSSLEKTQTKYRIAVALGQ